MWKGGLLRACNLLAVACGLVLLCGIDVLGPASLHVVHAVALVFHVLGVYAEYRSRAAKSQWLEAWRGGCALTQERATVLCGD